MEVFAGILAHDARITHHLVAELSVALNIPAEKLG
jgi:hypothetical protein